MIIYGLLWIAYGIVWAVLVWSNFFIMMHMSSKQGFSKWFWYVLGANLSELFIAGIAYYGISYFFAWADIRIALRWHIAAATSIILGLFMIIHKVSITRTVGQIHISLSYAYACIKWFIVNTSNPLLWIARIAAASYFVIQQNLIGFIWFVGGALLTIFVTDMFKAYYADKIAQYISPHKLQLIQRMFGLLIIIIGLFVRHKTTLCANNIDRCISKAQSQVDRLLNHK